VETNKTVQVTPPRVQGRLAFVSRSPIASDAGVAGFDALCAAEAQAANLPGTFRALVATSGASAAARFNVSAGAQTWVRGDGIPIVAGASDIATNNVLIPLVAAADGTKQGGNLVWTGAAGPGDLGAQTCGDWSGGGDGGVVGTAGTVHGRFTGAPGWFGNYGVMPPGFPNHLYCFQQ
jgi:hypothetical protein